MRSFRKPAEHFLQARSVPRAHSGEFNADACLRIYVSYDRLNSSLTLRERKKELELCTDRNLGRRNYKNASGADIAHTRHGTRSLVLLPCDPNACGDGNASAAAILFCLLLDHD